MKIGKLETFPVPPRWLFLRMETDEGVVGWGEPIVEGRAATVAAAVAELAELLVGRDPGTIEDHWQTLTKGGFYRGGPVLSSAVAGIDQALWDIKGKTLGVPVHDLLGGPVRDTVRVYPWIHGTSPGELADSARAAVAAGYDAMKFAAADGPLRPLDSPAALREIVARAAAVREAVGEHVDMALDFHGRASRALARQVLPALEELRPLFAEEVLLPEYSRDLRAVAENTTVPLATGERLYSRWDFRDVVTTGIAVVQPDLSHAGGISEVRRIAALAEAHDVLVAPHCPLGPIALAASLQIDFATPNTLIQEHSLGASYGAGDGLLAHLVDPEVFRFERGRVARPTGPGLGVEIDEASVRAAARRDHGWRNPVWRHEDGSLAEW
ncbi:galactonate dehydratase (plasmid) [Streptomyces sp. BI20]|uniref:galactonate dehydratase n=1 Tax=Streptomyces sp. BI20 TaxID=3403460 RepID=UPI003C75A2E2